MNFGLGALTTHLIYLFLNLTVLLVMLAPLIPLKVRFADRYSACLQRECDGMYD